MPLLYLFAALVACTPDPDPVVLPEVAVAVTDTGAVDGSADTAVNTPQLGEGTLLASVSGVQNTIDAMAITTAPEGTLYVGWVQRGDDGFRQLWVALSEDGGLTFSEPVGMAVPGDDVRAGWPRGPTILVTERRLVVAYSVASGPNYSVKVRAGLRTGTHVSTIAEIPLPPRYHDIAYPVLARHPEGDLFLALIANPYLSGELWVARERFGWAVENITRSSPLEVPCECCPPAIFMRASGEVVVGWRGNLAREMFIARAPTGDAAFGSFEQISQTGIVFDACPFDGPVIREERGKLLVAWADANPFEASKAWITVEEPSGWRDEEMASSDPASKGRVFFETTSRGGLAGYEVGYRGEYSQLSRPEGGPPAPQSRAVLGPGGPLHMLRTTVADDQVVAVGLDEEGSLWFVRLPDP